MKIGDLVELRHGTIGMIIGMSGYDLMRRWEIYVSDRSTLNVYNFIIKRVISESR